MIFLSYTKHTNLRHPIYIIEYSLVDKNKKQSIGLRTAETSDLRELYTNNKLYGWT